MRAQITIFIILGVVVVLVAVAFYVFLPSLKSEQTKIRTQQIQGIPKEVEPIVNYVEACIEQVAKEGLFLMGQQGGYLYEAQGSLKIDYDPSQEGKFFITYKQLRVPYRLQKSIGGPKCVLYNPQTPNYPSTSAFYPYSRDPTTPLAVLEYAQPGCFGRRIPLDSDKAAAQLDDYIENKFVASCPLSGFPQFTITAGTAAMNISSSASKTTYTLNYPLELTNKNTNARTSLQTFTTSQLFSLERLYTFVNTLLYNDTTDPRFDISTVIDPDFGVSIIPNQLLNDDLILISSPKLKLLGEPFTFTFARRNRAPALEYVSFHSQIQQGTKLASDFLQGSLMAVDPDEDVLTITLFINNVAIHQKRTYPNSTIEIVLDIPIDTGSAVNGAFTLPARAEVTDGQFSDFQTFDVQVNP